MTSRTVTLSTGGEARLRNEGASLAAVSAMHDSSSFQLFTR